MKRILKLSFIFHVICLLVFFDTLFCEDLPKPRGVFSAVFWEKYNSNSFSYAPWGNENDENASIVNISVGASSLSRPFVYYGDKKISFYEKIRPREWEDIDSDSDDQPLGKLAAEFEFPKDDSGLEISRRSNERRFIYKPGLFEGIDIFVICFKIDAIDEVIFGANLLIPIFYRRFDLNF